MFPLLTFFCTVCISCYILVLTYHLDQKVLGLVTVWRSRSADFNSSFFVVLPEVSLTFWQISSLIAWYLLKWRCIVYIYLCVGFDFSQKKMSSTLHQRVCIEFCVKNRFDGAQTLEMLEKCLGNDTLTRSNVFRWHERFRSGRESVEDDERSGRSSTAKTDKNINKIKGWMTVSRKLTIREIAEELNIAYGSAQDILVNDLGLRRVATKLVQKYRRTMPSLSVSICLKTKRIPPNNHRFHLIWLPATFAYSVDSRNRSVERVTAPKMRSWKNRRWLWWLWWLYRKPIIKNVSRIGSSAGISALQSMGSTLKGTISIMMNKLVFLIWKIKS